MKKGTFSPPHNFVKLELDFVQDTYLLVLHVKLCCLSLLMEEQGLEQKPRAQFINRTNLGVQEGSILVFEGRRLAQKCIGLAWVSSASFVKKWLREGIIRSDQDDFDPVGTTLSWTLILSKRRLACAQLRREALARCWKALLLPSPSILSALASLPGPMPRQTNKPT